MAEFGTVFLYNMRAFKPGYDPLFTFFCANIDRKRQMWPAAWCGLHYFSH